MQAMEIVSFEERSAAAIHEDAMSVAKNIKNEYLRLFEILLIVERRQIYYEFDIPTLKIYCTELLGLSSSIANDFIVVVRKSLEVPELADAVRSGQTTISKARKICPVVTPSNHRDWIGLAIECSAREIERTVAMANPKLAVGESMKFVSGDALEFKLGVSEEWAVLLKRTKDLLSQKERRVVSSEEAIFSLMAEFCRKNDPVEKAKRWATKEEKLQKRTDRDPETDSNSIAAQSRYIPADIEHAVDLRDSGQCTHIDSNGTRCEERRWLAKHHIREFADGGEHSVENLVTLCFGHHKIRHLKLAPSLSRDK